MVKKIKSWIIRPFVIEVILIIPVFVMTFVFSFSNSENIKPSPYPVNGLLDLSNWDFKRDKASNTTGYWEFYFGEFLTSRQFDTVSIKYYAWVPGVWKRQYFSAQDTGTFKKKKSSSHLPVPWKQNSWKGKKLGATGFASYRLTVIFPPGQGQVAFQMKSIVTAYRFFVDDSLVVSNGTVGTSRETSIPQFLNRTVVVNIPKDTVHLTFWISNFHYRKGGLSSTVVIGDPEYLQTVNRNNNYSVLLTAGMWLAVCFVLISFYFFHTKEKHILYMLFWALSALIRLISADDRVITEIFPGISFEAIVKMELITGFSTIPFAYMLMQSLFPAEFSRHFKNFLFSVFLIHFLIVMTTHSIVYSYLVVPLQVLSIATLAYMLYCLILAMVHKREGSFILGICIPVVFSFFIIQIAFYNNLSNINLGSNVMSVGIIMAFAQIVLLSKISSSAQKRVENFALELENTVKERTRELIKAQDQLIISARQTETEKVRRRISRDIHDDISSGLNKITWMIEMIKIRLLKAKPEEFMVSLNSLSKISRETVDHLTEIIWSLNPVNDKLDSHLCFMRDYATKFLDGTPFKVTINFPINPDHVDLNPELARNLFLIMKESLNNAAKYSEAKNIIIEFKTDGSSYYFSISDDGTGIEEGVIKGDGNGMINMRKRMDAVKGKFTVDSTPGQGTRIILEGPVY